MQGPGGPESECTWTPHFFVAETLKNGLYQLTFATSQVVKGVQHGGPMSSVITASVICVLRTYN